MKGDNYYLNCDVWSLGIIILEGAIGWNPLLRLNEKREGLDFMKFVQRVQEKLPEVPSEYSSDFREFIS